MALTSAFIAVSFISITEQQKRADKVEAAQERAGKVESAARANDARKARREQIREARIRQAEIKNESAATGQTGSSAAVAAGDSLQAQLGTNIGSIQEALQVSSAQTNAQQDIFKAERKSSTELASGAAMSGLSLFS
mgnify:FL=1